MAQGRASHQELGTSVAVSPKVISGHHSPPPLAPGGSAGVPVRRGGAGVALPSADPGPTMRPCARGHGHCKLGPPPPPPGGGESQRKPGWLGQRAVPGPVSSGPYPAHQHVSSPWRGLLPASLPCRPPPAPRLPSTPQSCWPTQTSLCWQKPGCLVADPELSLPQPCLPPAPLWANGSLCLGSLGAPLPSHPGRVFWNLQSMKWILDTGRRRL